MILCKPNTCLRAVVMAVRSAAASRIGEVNGLHNFLLIIPAVIGIVRNDQNGVGGLHLPKAFGLLRHNSECVFDLDVGEINADGTRPEVRGENHVEIGQLTQSLDNPATISTDMKMRERFLGKGRELDGGR